MKPAAKRRRRARHAERRPVPATMPPVIMDVLSRTKAGAHDAVVMSILGPRKQRR